MITRYARQMEFQKILAKMFNSVKQLVFGTHKVTLLKRFQVLLKRK